MTVEKPVPNEVVKAAEYVRDNEAVIGDETWDGEWEVERNETFENAAKVLAEYVLRNN